MAYERPVAGLGDEKSNRSRDLDPQLVWRGKDQQDWSGLVVHAPPLYIQEIDSNSHFGQKAVRP